MFTFKNMFLSMAWGGVVGYFLVRFGVEPNSMEFWFFLIFLVGAFNLYFLTDEK